MEIKLAENKVIEQVPFTVDPENNVERFEICGDFLDHVELRVCSFIREIIREYAKDEFMRYTGAAP